MANLTNPKAIELRKKWEKESKGYPAFTIVKAELGGVVLELERLQVENDDLKEKLRKCLKIIKRLKNGE